MLAGVLFKALFVSGALLFVLAPLASWLERRQGALLQDRVGPDRVDLFGVSAAGLLYPLAVAIKLFNKEDVVPAAASPVLFRLSPVLVIVPALIVFAVIPYGGLYAFGDSTVNLVVADVDWGVLYVLVLGTLASLGMVVAGWSSRSHWALLGGVREAAQIVSVGVVLGLGLVPVLMVFGTLQLPVMAAAQDSTLALGAIAQRTVLGGALDGLPWLSAVGLPAWGAILQPISFVLCLIGLAVSSGRVPFDLAEAGSELVGGYATEYSGLRLGLFRLAALTRVVAAAALMTTIFLGGWAIPYLSQQGLISLVDPFYGEGAATGLCLVAHVVCFFGKVVAMIWLLTAIRWSLPRFRYDQLMDLCWKILLPLALLNVFVTAGVMLSLGLA